MGAPRPLFCLWKFLDYFSHTNKRNLSEFLLPVIIAQSPGVVIRKGLKGVTMKLLRSLVVWSVLLIVWGLAFAQPAWQENPLQMGYMEFPIASVDNLFIPYSNPSLLGTGAASGIGIAHLNDDEVWKRHYWLLLNTEGLSYAYERDEGTSFHMLATGFELFPAYIFPNVYAGVNYRWREKQYKDGTFRSGVTYRPLDATSVAFTWDNPMDGKPFYRGGLAVRPFALVPSIADHRLELSMDMNYARYDADAKYEFKDPVWGIQTQLLNGLKVGATYNTAEKTTLLNFSLCFDKSEVGGLTRMKDNDNYGIAWAHSTELNYKPFLGLTPKTWLNMKLTGNILTYTAPKYEIGPFKIYDSNDKSIETIINTLKKAKDDDRIQGILLKNPYFATSIALQQELLDAFAEFKSSGKKVSFYYDNMGNAGYVFAASIADKIYLNPMGSIDLRGLAINSPYLKNMLSSLGIEVLNFRSHKYKNAGNMFSETEMTSAEREVYDSILQSFWDELVLRLHNGRGDKLSEPAADIINSGPYFLAKDALEKGLVDELIYEDELSKQLKKDFKFNKQSSHLTTYRSYDWAKEKESQIAVIYASGNIVMGSGTPGTKIAHKSTVKLIRDARKNKLYKGIILRVDSGGGSAQASDIILRELELAQTENKKPVVVSMAGVAGSGGYYIACKADRIVADPSTITGSIGVIGLQFNATEMFKKIKVNWSTVKKGEHADMGSMNRPWTAEEKEMITESIEYIYEDFVKKVDDGRKTLDLAQVHEYAQGRIWTGAQALDIGLIDDLGGLDVAVNNMRDLTGLKGKLVLVDATTSETGIKMSFDQDKLNAWTPLKAFNSLSSDYVKLYELWEDFAGDKALMLSEDVPELIQF